MRIIRLLLSADQRNFFELINERHRAEHQNDYTVEDTIAAILEAVFLANKLDAKIQFLDVPDEAIKT